jgi:RNA polymerase sigma-70 factor, ECF subfamily
MAEGVEDRIRRRWDVGDRDGAATEAMNGYGPEIYGFLVARMRDEGLAAEAFSELGEDLWRGIAGFEWRSTFRTWLYTLARHAALRVERSPPRRRESVPLSHVAHVAERVRSETAPHLRTENKDALLELRRELDPDDQTLLTLRLDRRLSWNEIAAVMIDDLAAEDMASGAARVRQRFQKLKERLRRRAREVGLVP